MQSIESQFRERGVQRGGILFLQPVDALAMLNVCRGRNVRVLGIDGFSLDEENTQPLMEHSIDLGRLTDNSEGWRLAEQFLRGYLDSNLYFEVVLE